MNRIKCVLCGSESLEKNGDYFICSGCGAKYSLAEAKKLISDTVEKETEKSRSVSSVKTEELHGKESNIIEQKNDRDKINNDNRFRNECILDVINSYSVPKLCACCLSDKVHPTEISATSTTRSSSYRKRYTISAKSFVCSECSLHEQETRKKVKTVTIIATVLGVIAHIILVFLTKGNNYFLAGVAGFLSVPLFYAVIASLVRLPALPDNHSARCDFVSLSSKDLPSGRESTYSMFSNRNNQPIQSLTFCFTNEKYAQIMKEMNPVGSSSVEKKKVINTAGVVSLLKAVKGSIGNAFAVSFIVNMVLTLIMILVTFRMFHPLGY